MTGRLFEISFIDTKNIHPHFWGGDIMSTNTGPNSRVAYFLIDATLSLFYSLLLSAI